jgi:hypothetical protein
MTINNSKESRIEPKGLATVASEIMAYNQELVRQAENQSKSNLIWQEGELTFTEIIRQEYSNCVFSAGSVSGHPVDTLYLKIERNNRVDTFLLLRPDEMAAIGWLATGALWSLLMREDNNV